MVTVAACLFWVAALALALYGSERLVHSLTGVGAVIHLSAGILGLLVALGADAPEVTSALIALARGSTDIGLGVVLGSNVYNLAGLLGLGVLTAGQIPIVPHRLAIDGSANLLLTITLFGLLLAPAWHAGWGLALMVEFAVYVAIVVAGRDRALPLVGRRNQAPEPGRAAAPSPPESPRITVLVAVAVGSVGAILVGSTVLVNESISLGPRLGISTSIIGTFVLPIATSLPNTVAAISLARRRLGSAAVAATFNSNSINVALGTGLPAVLLGVHASTASRTLDLPWLAGMTAVALIALASRWTLTRVEGSLLIALYFAFVALRLSIFR